MRKSEVLENIREYLKLAQYSTNDDKLFRNKNIGIYIMDEPIKDNDIYIQLIFTYKDRYVTGEFIDCSDKNAEDNASHAISFFTRIILRLKKHGELTE